MPKVSKDMRDNVKNLILKKQSEREISKALGLSKSTVHRLAIDMKIKTQGVGGRKKKLSSPDVTYCVTKLCSNEVKTAQGLVKTLEKD